MTTSASLQTKLRPSMVSFALACLVVGFAIPILRAALAPDAQFGRIATITIVSLAVLSVAAIAFLRGWQVAWWILVLGTLLDASGVVLDLTAGRLGHAQPGLDRVLLAVQYVFELAVFVLLLHPTARRWFGVGGTAERSTRDVA
jgi:hypothetical protein